VNLLLCDLAGILKWLVSLYMIVMIAYAVTSWIPDLRSGRFAYYLARIVEPVVAPIRRVIPPLGGLDIAFLLVLLVLQFVVQPMLSRLAIDTCIAIF
jgi:YggT family protein